MPLPSSPKVKQKVKSLNNSVYVNYINKNTLPVSSKMVESLIPLPFVVKSSETTLSASSSSSSLSSSSSSSSVMEKDHKKINTLRKKILSLNNNKYKIKNKTKLFIKGQTDDKFFKIKADHLDPEDWDDLIKSFEENVYQTLYLYSNFEEFTIKPFLFYFQSPIIEILVESIKYNMVQTKELKILQLHSIPTINNNFKEFSDAINYCQSIQYLNLTHCLIGDENLRILCDAIIGHVGINTIDVSSCCLTFNGAKHIADLIRDLRHDRYDLFDESASSDNDKCYSEKIYGLQRIILNDNPKISDDGFIIIKQELINDIWINGLELQNCGLSFKSANEALKLIHCNKTIKILDMRKNKQIPHHFIKQIQINLLSKDRGIIIESKNKTDPPCNNNLINNNDYFNNRNLENISNKDYTNLVSSYSQSSVNINDKFKLNRKPVTPKRSREAFYKNKELKRLLSQANQDLLKERDKSTSIHQKNKGHISKLSNNFKREWMYRKNLRKECYKLKDTIHGLNNKIINQSREDLNSNNKIKSIKSNSSDKTITITNSSIVSLQKSESINSIKSSVNTVISTKSEFKDSSNNKSLNYKITSNNNKNKIYNIKKIYKTKNGYKNRFEKYDYNIPELQFLNLFIEQIQNKEDLTFFNEKFGKRKTEKYEVQSN